jgi:DNA-binding XRE family transcriptional regulator
VAARLDKVPPKHRKAVEAQLRNISIVIQARRKELGITQEQLAESLDLAVMTIQFIEQQQRYPSLPVLFYICKAMDITVKIGNI